MITLETKLETIMRRGSIINEEEKEFLISKYQLLKQKKDPFLSFEKELKAKIDVLLERCKGIYDVSFSIQLDSYHYIYKKSENEIYDIASITKLFTYLLVEELAQRKILSLSEKVSAILPECKKIGSLTILELLKMSGKIETREKLSTAKDKEEFMNTLYTVHPVSTNKKAIYTDVGFTLLRFLVEKQVLYKTGKKMTYDLIMKEYLLDPYQIKGITYQPSRNLYHLKGNGNTSGACHDQKTRKIDSISGAAGLFATVEGMDPFLKKFEKYQILSRKQVEDIFMYRFEDTNGKARSYAGMYLPCGPHIKNYISRLYSNHTIVHHGFTGATILIDFENHITNSIFVNAIQDKALEKSKEFLKEFRWIQNTISLYSLLLYLLCDEE